MHIIIADVFLSLDKIITISDVKSGSGGEASFYINYHSGKEISFYYNASTKESVEFYNTAFYIKSQNAFNLIRTEILQILINAAQPNQTGKAIPA